MERLAKLEDQLSASMADKTRLEGEVELCTQKLDRAEKLITVRWSRHVELNPTEQAYCQHAVVHPSGVEHLAHELSRVNVLAAWRGLVQLPQ